MKKVGIIIPCYMESQDIKRHVEALKDYLKKIDNYHFDIVLVNDGSKDETEDVINAIPGVKTISYYPNKGKGNAVREGIKFLLESLDDDYYIFMDADMSTDIEAVDSCLSSLEEGNDLVLASRYDKESQILIKQPFKRRFISKCSRIIIGMMFHFKVKDTQCGFKGMNKDLAKLLIEKSKMDGFSFDVEYLYISKLYNKNYKSLPVKWSDDRTSTLSPFKSSIKFFKDLFKIKRNKKHYLS